MLMNDCEGCLKNCIADCSCTCHWSKQDWLDYYGEQQYDYAKENDLLD